MPSTTRFARSSVSLCSHSHSASASSNCLHGENRKQHHASNMAQFDYDVQNIGKFLDPLS